MEELLEYEGLVYSIINKYSKRFDHDDLYQVGMMGLMEAYKHYDNSFQTKFSTFAYYYVIGEVNKYIRESSSIKVSKGLIELKRKIVQAKETMSQRLGREPTNVEISLFLEVDESLVEDALLATEEIDSLDTVYEFPDQEMTSTRADILDLKNEIEKLDDQEKKIIYQRYYQEMTQQETSEVLGISQVQVSRKEAKILQKLKLKL